MKNETTARTEIHYAPAGDYQLPLLTLPQTASREPLGGPYERTESAGRGSGGEGDRVSIIFLVYPYEHGIMEQRRVIP